MTSCLQIFEQPHAIRFGWALIHILWQGLVIAALLESALFFVRSKNASLRYILCGAALLLFPISLAITYSVLGEGIPAPNPLIPPHDQKLPPLPAASTFASSLPSLFPHPLQSSVRNSPASPSLALNPYIPTIVALWLLGVLLLAARKAGGFIVIWRLRHRSLVAPTQALLDQFHRICQRLCVDPNRVALKISSLISVPITMGWLKPIVLLPASLLSGLTSSEIELLLAHELAHIRRHDYLINLFQAVVETLFFYHPVTWWISRRMKQERENACDDLIAREPSQVLAYAQVLLRLEQLRPAGSGLISAANGGNLLQRIQRLTGEPASQRALGLPALALLIGLLVALIAAPLLKAQNQPAAVAAKAAPKSETSTQPPATNPQLIEAVQKNDVSALKKLINQGADPKAISSDGRTLLFDVRGLEVAECLLDHGVNPNLRDKSGITAIGSVILMSGKRGGDAARMLLEHHADGPTMLTLAAWTNKTDVIAYLLDHGVDPNQPQIIGHRNGHDIMVFPATAAAMTGSSDALKLLLAHGARADDAVVTALHNGQAHTVKVLWDSGVRIISELCYQISQGATVADVQKLLDQGSPVDPPQDKVITPLGDAAMLGKLDVVKLLVERHADVNKGDVINRAEPRSPVATPLWLAAGEGQDEVIDYLLQHGARADFGALRNATYNCNPYGSQRTKDHFEKTEKLFLDAGALKSLTDGQKGEILSAAIASRNPGGNVTVLKMLLDAGLSPELPVMDSSGNKLGTVLGTNRDWCAKYPHDAERFKMQPLLDMLEAADKGAAGKSETSTQSPVAPTTAAPDQSAATAAGKDARKMVRLGMKVIQLSEDDYQAHHADIEAALGKGDVEPLAKLASFHLLSDPGVLTRSGEQCVMEAIRVMPVAVKFQRDPSGKLVPTEYDRRNVGVRLPIHVSANGETIDLNGKLDLTTFQGYVSTGEKSFQPCFNASETYFVQQMPSGATRGLEVAGTQAAVGDAESISRPDQVANPATPPQLARQFLFITAQLYTQDGKPIPPLSAAHADSGHAPMVVGSPPAIAAAPTPSPDPTVTAGADVSLKLTLPPEVQPDFAQSRGDLISSDKKDFTMTADANGVFTAHRVPPGSYDEMIRLGRKLANGTTVFTGSSFGPVAVDTKNIFSQVAWDPAGMPPPKGDLLIEVKVAQFDEDAYAANKNKIDAAVDNGDLRAFIDLINKLPGASLISAPSVSTKPGLKANIDIVREMPYPTEFEPPKIVKNLTYTPPDGSKPTTELTGIVGVTPREFVTKDVGVSAEIMPSVVTEEASPHGSIILDGKFTLTTFEGFTKSNLVRTGTPSFSTSESHFIEALKNNGSCGIWIPGPHMVESDANGKLPSGRVIAPNTTLKQRMLIFLTASLAK
jgi:beta-lactamase regulating signal transducer with metallopeptidase domain/ankyrin repeat protein